MTKSYQPYCKPNTRRVSDWIIGVCKDTSGAMLTVKCRVDRPMPGIVILVHGVNDIGEAYPSQEQGIIAGLNQRLGRTDLITIKSAIKKASCDNNWLTTIMQQRLI